MKEQFLAEGKGLKAMGLPVDMNTAAITGARISMQKGDRVAIVLQMGSSTAAVVEATLKQHNAASSGTSKALTVANPYYHKAGNATTFTKVLPANAASVYDLSTVFAADGGILVFEVLAEDLDVDNGFAWVSVDLADSNAAKLVAGLYLLGNTRFSPAYDIAL